MKTFIPGPLTDNARNLLRRLGYGEQTKFSGQTAFIKRVSGGDFPRYHAYVEDRDGGLQVNLHIDQKAATYEGSHAHSGEYEGSLVEQEMKYIVAWVNHWKQEESQQQQTAAQQKSKNAEPKEKKNSLWG
jgi:hypothetical protein